MATPMSRKPMPWLVLIGVLVGFPAFFFLWSLALLHREALAIPGLGFFPGYWIATAAIYAAKIWLVLYLLRRNGWSPADIGLPTARRHLTMIVVGYIALAVIAFVAVEYAAAHATFDGAKLARLPGLYPETTEKRIALLFMAFFAGISEEITYRGFAVSGLMSRGVNRWAAFVLAAFPFVFQHGLKSLDQFWWFFLNGLFLGAVYVVTRRLLPGIVIHWLIIWLALIGIFSAVVS